MSVTLDSLKKTVGRKIGKSKIFAWLADLERASGNLDTALNIVDEGLFANANDIAGMLVRAKVLLQKERYEDCLAQCEKVLQKDPFNLAALKIMGDAYDKLGNEAERNLCYRQYHDMDPLNNFWKDEYDVSMDAAMAASTAAFAEGELDMPSGDGESLDLNFEEAGGFEKSNDDAFVEETAVEKSVDTQENASVESAESPFSSPFSSTFEKSNEDVPKEKSAANPIFGSGFGSINLDFNEQEETASEESVAEVPVAEPAAEESAAVFDVPAEEDDPFAALAAMLPNSEVADDSALDDLAASLDTALQSAEYGNQNEQFPVDDNISGNDVNSALSDIFGLDDDLEVEESAAPKVEDIVLDEEAEANASNIFSAPSVADEDKPMSVDNAFDSIFGEDELPEEIGPAVAEPVAEEAVVEETVAEEAVAEEAPAAPADDKPMSVDNAFDSIFGEDELPEEKTVETSSAADVFGSGLFEKSASATIFGNSFAETTETETPAEESLELPVEEESLELPAEESLELPVEEENLELPAEESLELPVEEENLELPAEESLELPAEKESGVAEAFGNIFGEDDDLPVEKFVAPVEKPEDPVIASPMDFVLAVDDKPETVAEQTAEETVAPVDESALAVDDAFGSIFGEDDDLPVEKTAEAVDVPAAASSLAEQVNSAETELELPVAEEKLGEDLAQEMGGAFASMFGNDDELDLPEATPSSVSDQESTGAAIEEVAATVSSEEAKSDLDKSFDTLFGDDDSLELPSEPAKLSPDLGALESEVSGAFKGLFDMEDDALDESMPTNKGVDFLMSGDSDDEVSASLINNPDAPLDRGSHDLDESLNTRTLAEIYFDQGLYGKAIDIYADLAQKEPNNEEIRARLDEIEKIYRTKFGGNA